MMTKIKTGNIDFIKNGFVAGWATTTPDITQPNQCHLLIDGKFVSSFDANLYREDLKAESIRFGIVGFLQAIPLIFCDGQEHQLSLQTPDNQLINQVKKLIPRNRNLVDLDENIVFDRINKAFGKHKKVMFLAGFTRQTKLLNYQKHFVRAFQQAGYYVIYVIASDTPDTVTGVFGDADRVIIRRNLGYDFGSWATVFQLCQREFFAAQEIIWANDSMIGPLNSIDQLLKKIDHSATELWAITDSQDIKYHFQSYFWGLKKKAKAFVPALDAFFFYRHALPKDKKEAISHYELEAHGFFKQQGLTIDILFPEHALIPLAEEKFITALQAHSEKWQPLFKLPLMKDEVHKLNVNVLDMTTILINRFPTNPSHSYWNALLDSGFPFVKRELLTLNPAHYPFPGQFRAAFEQHGATHLLDDLVGTLTFTHII